MRKLFVVCLLAIGVAVVGVADAAEQAPLRKNPALSGILSALITGGGQVYNGQYIKGSVFFASAVTGSTLLFSALNEDGDDIDPDKEGRAAVGALVLLSAYVASIVDAVISAEKINMRNEGRAHFIELGKEQRIGLDPIRRRGGWGAMATLRF